MLSEAGKNKVSPAEDSVLVHFTKNWILLISQVLPEMVLLSIKPAPAHLLPNSQVTSTYTITSQADSLNFLQLIPQICHILFFYRTSL